jgi:hypothetical protein
LKIAIDGREFDFPSLETLTFREAGLIKKITGLRMGQFAEAFENGDTDMVLSLALVAKMREDADVDAEALLDTPIAKVDVIVEDGDMEEVEEEGNVGAADDAADETSET